MSKSDNVYLVRILTVFMGKLIFLWLPIVLFAAAPKSYPVAISVAEVIVQKDQKTNTYLANVKAKNSASLALERSGIVTKVGAKDFSHVKKGQMILAINSAILDAQINSAQAQLKLSKIEFARVNKLYAGKALPASELDKARSNLQIAQSNYDMLVAQKAQTILKAPFDGYIGGVAKSIGEFVTAGSQMTNIRSVGEYLAEFYVPQEQIHNINNMTKVTVVIDQKIFSGKNLEKDNSADENTRLVKVRAYFSAKPVLPGSFAKVNLTFSSGKNVLLVPETSVLYSEEGSHIYKMQGNKPVKVKIKTGLPINGQIPVISGLLPGDKIVSVGQFKLFPNAPIVIVS